MKSKLIKIITLSLIIALLLTVSVYADVYDAAKNLTKDVADTIKTMSTPSALIGVGSGAFMKKFSMGDHQKVATGNKVFWGSILGWASINGLTLILDTVSKYIK